MKSYQINTFVEKGNPWAVFKLNHSIGSKKEIHYQNIDHAKGQAFNIGGGMVNSLSLLELFSLLEAITGVELNYTKISVRESDQKIFVADITKAKDILNWKPEINPNEGISKMIEWLTSECIL